MNDGIPFLAYSPMLSIEGSSEPFRAFLGAILSVINDVPVSPSTCNPEMKLYIIIEDPDQDIGPLHENDLDDGSGAYWGNLSKGTGTKTRTSSRLANRLENCTQVEGDGFGLIGVVKVSFKMWLQGGFMRGFRPTVNFGFKAEKLLKT